MLLFRYGSRHGGSKGTFRGEETDSAEALQERALALCARALLRQGSFALIR